MDTKLLRISVSLGLIGLSPCGLGDVLQSCPLRLTIALKISRQEGWLNSRSLVHRLRNPGALVYANQPGATRGSRGFAKFRTEQEGWAALERDLRLKLREGRSLKKAWAYLEDPPKGIYFGY